MAQVIDHLLSKYEAWNSNPSLPKKKEQKSTKKGRNRGRDRKREGGREEEKKLFVTNSQPTSY
jgi:hypothetical protein